MSTNKGSHILEVRGKESAELFKALASDTRLEILTLLAEGDKNINEICLACGIAQPTATKHIQVLEQAGLVTSEYMPGQQGMQKRCSIGCDRLLISFENLVGSDLKMDEVSMPIGLYTLANPSPTCGLANRERMIGFVDIPQSFYDPERAGAQILWMADGFVEYVFPCTLPSTAELRRLELMMEICSEAPNYDPDYPSDITLWINGVEVGTWTSPGDFGGKRGLLNPDWWIDHMTQYGAQKIWSVDQDGAYVDGTKVSDVNLERALVVPNQPISVRIGIKPEAEHPGGFNLFGSGFGNYAQDLVLRLHYLGRKISVQHQPGALIPSGRGSEQ
ncbi:ArsR/SmtB family transcription factor [Fimbriimonas ginsengisoli]|uniref:Regulatory protein ArsR n=1 Tax=Fimbriimonas ginsengisoli Gsoil 348 TaxID=661478 RepID=A0A068NQF4_FIMGI|nr:metalloregulator ArsR/SmtB family transcription factor [Fimbriimonas ginsengisoli]AIE85577.1 regulatory protein ArsR [Fimbriimonas ginsengisoli Gsoil 348]